MTEYHLFIVPAAYLEVYFQGTLDQLHLVLELKQQLSLLVLEHLLEISR